MPIILTTTTTTVLKSFEIGHEEIEELIREEARKMFGRKAQVDVEFDCYGGGHLRGASVSCKDVETIQSEE